MSSNGPVRIGLDVGSTGVRAAEVVLGSDPRSLVRVGQVLLPPGVDLVPFALIRAVGQDEGLGLEEYDAVGGFFLSTMLGGEEPQEQAAPTPSPPPVPAAPGTSVGKPK